MIDVIVGLVLGAFSWTFLEYALHAWLGHWARGRNLFSREHLAHHADTRYFPAWQKKALFALPVLTGLAALAAPLWGWLAGGAFACGVGGMWLTYEVIHRRLHTHAPQGPVSRWLRRHHFAHHFGNPNLNHGVTTPIWDLVFRTYDAPGVVRVPAKQVAGMPWLIGGEDGTVAPAFTGDYRIVGAVERREEPVPALATR